MPEPSPALLVGHSVSDTAPFVLVNLAQMTLDRKLADARWQRAVDAAIAAGHSVSVIAAFPATGKTFVAGRDHRFLDCDSSAFSWEPGEQGRKRHPDWPENYIDHLVDTVERGTWVLASTHTDVRYALQRHEIPFSLVYPEVGLRDEYRQRMLDRGSPAWLVEKIDSTWPEMIASCEAQRGCEHIVLRAGQYLTDVLPGVVAR